MHSSACSEAVEVLVEEQRTRQGDDIETGGSYRRPCGRGGRGVRRPRRNMHRQEQRLGDSNEAWAEDRKGRAGEGGSDDGSGD